MQLLQFALVLLSRRFEFVHLPLQRGRLVLPLLTPRLLSLLLGPLCLFPGHTVFQAAQRLLLLDLSAAGPFQLLQSRAFPLLELPTLCQLLQQESLQPVRGVEGQVLGILLVGSSLEEVQLLSGLLCLPPPLLLLVQLLDDGPVRFRVPPTGELQASGPFSAGVAAQLCLRRLQQASALHQCPQYTL